MVLLSRIPLVLSQTGLVLSRYRIISFPSCLFSPKSRLASVAVSSLFWPYLGIISVSSRFPVKTTRLYGYPIHRGGKVKRSP